MSSALRAWCEGICFYNFSLALESHSRPGSDQYSLLYITFMTIRVALTTLPGSGGRLVAGCRMVRDGVPEGGGFRVWVLRAGFWVRVLGMGSAHSVGFLAAISRL